MKKNNSIVSKSNDLIESSYKLSLQEQKIVLYLVSLINPEDKEFKPYCIQSKTVAEILNINPKNVYRDLKRISRNLRKKDIIIFKENSILETGWISSFEYFAGEGYVEITFDPKLKPYLLQIKNRFTSYRLKDVVTLNSTYSIRVYELLKQHENFKERTLEIDKLKFFLGIPDKYKRYCDFKRRVLVTAYEEINEKTDLNIDFIEIKKGRIVEKIKFVMKGKKDCEIDKPFDEVAITQEFSINPYVQDLKKIIEEELSEEECEKILKVANNDIEIIKKKYEIVKSSKYDNLVGFLISAITKDYKAPIKNNQSKAPNKFHNFEQRTAKYNKEELEHIFRNNK